MSNYGIGLYQPLQAGSSVYGNGFPDYHTNPVVVAHPWSGIYGGTYGYIVDKSIPTPQRATKQPSVEIGIDTLGFSVVRGYPQITWTWHTLRPDKWYQLLRMRALSARTAIGAQFLVLLQYPDPEQNGDITQVLARWEPLTHGNRDVGAYYDVTAHFTYVGQMQLDPMATVQMLPSS